MDKYPEITFAVENKFKQLIKDNLTPWEFLYTGKMAPATDFYGHTIQYSGIGFEGSPREVFWSLFMSRRIIWAGKTN